ncbi:ATP-grasp domain-containing protein [Streptomyces sp. SID8352]|uniref:ATP-grasp domain-containing protein n=1 Tax=Streptomyces sp. SID8352 TaxID=2690338 RepID=UPI001370B659|nr:ATP-grasp domain-containing protein [Streptomyces sp. SID8352]MYU20474.1 ATP-grasp domain-containing protein [Streptomyces sp. SID8352]
MERRLAVVYENGSVNPLELAVAASGRCALVLVCDPSSEGVRPALPLLRETGTVVTHDDGTPPEETAARLQHLGVDGITTFSDLTVELTAVLARLLGLDFHDPLTAALLVDKHRQRARLAQAGLPTPRHAAVPAEAGEQEVRAAVTAVGAPAVVKPRRGAGSRNTVLVRTEEEGVRTVTALRAAGERELVLEEYLAGDATVAGPQWGDYVSVESVAHGGRITHIGVTGKPPLLEPFRETGAFFPADLPAPVRAELLAATGDALRALGVSGGVTHTEFKLTADGPRLIEVNGRLGGFVNDVVGRATGFPLLRTALDCALGGPPGPLTVPAPGRVAYQRFLAPPVDARAVSSVTGVREARALPGVRRVELAKSPGQPVDWRQGTQAFVGIVYGDAPDHRALAERLAELDGVLRVAYDTGSEAEGAEAAS